MCKVTFVKKNFEVVIPISNNFVFCTLTNPDRCVKIISNKLLILNIKYQP